MSRFLKLASGLDTLPILLELHRAEHLWDADTIRKTYAGSPHTQMSDIYARFMPKADLACLETAPVEFRSVMWPAWHALPSLRPLVRALKHQVDAVELGSILITRLPPGGLIGMHTDKGGWAAEYFRIKATVILSGMATYTCDGEEAVFERGDVFTFDNILQHSVANHGSEDRIAVIVSMRTDP